jgi:plastocyanin
MNRRKLLATGASALAAALAGCSGDGGGSDTTTADTTTSTAATTTAATTTESTTASTTTNSGDTTTTTAESGGSGSVTVVTVAPNGEYRFDPQTVTVPQGETVRWEWAGPGHNVRPGSQPADADWTGTPGGDGETYDEGYAYEFTFEVPGQYDYYCAPHRSIGMTGSVVVE